MLRRIYRTPMAEGTGPTQHDRIASVIPTPNPVFLERSLIRAPLPQIPSRALLVTQVVTSFADPGSKTGIYRSLRTFLSGKDIALSSELNSLMRGTTST